MSEYTNDLHSTMMMIIATNTMTTVNMIMVNIKGRRNIGGMMIVINPFTT